LEQVITSVRALNMEDIRAEIAQSKADDRSKAAPAVSEAVATGTESP
jgi:hypothetical protein